MLLFSQTFIDLLYSIYPLNIHFTFSVTLSNTFGSSKLL